MSADALLNAESTALRVLRWSARQQAASSSAGQPRDPLPSGPLRDPRSLLRASSVTLATLGECIRDTAARLGAGRPPFGDPGSAGLGALFVAAAIGGWGQRDAALILAEAIRPPRLVDGGPASGIWVEALARHAVVGPVAMTASATAQSGPETKLGSASEPESGSESESLTETLLRLSPLTAVLHRPPLAALAGDAAPEAAAALALAARPRGARTLRIALAQWSADPAVLAWRTLVLARFVSSALPEQQALAADTYVTACVRNGADWTERLRAAGRGLSRRGKPAQSDIATIQYWAPLATLSRTNPDMVRSRPFLDGYDHALALVRRYGLDTAGRLGTAVAA